MADLIGQTIDHYLIERYIGQGGMGSVFQARDISLGRQVAIKFIHPHLASQEKFQQQFLQQIRDAAAFDHPNIVRIFAHDYRDDHLYLVMEYIAEGSLRDYLDQLQGEQMRLDDMIQVAAQAADALDYAHERGIIHRNLKPENILFKKRPTADLSTGVDAALADVGLAQVAARLTGTTVGLPSAMFLYMAPEQALSQQLDGRVDIYALGVIMYQMVAGRPPYQPRSITEAMQMKTQPIPPPSTIRPGIPPELDRIILECMAAEPDGRYQSADELLQDLRPLQTDRLRREAIEV
jgi:serine/threonine-protein kinase